MRFIGIIVLLFLVFGCNTKRLRSKAQFAELYVQALKKANPTVTFVLNPELTITSKKGDKEYTHIIDNAYFDYESEPDAIEEIINKYVASSSELLSSRSIIALERIIPVIKSKEYLDNLRSVGVNPDSAVIETYNDQLIIVYSENTETSTRTLTAGRFKTLGISMDSLRRVALENLDRIIPLIKRNGENGTYTIDAGGDYEASLLLISSFWTKETLPVDGDFVVAIPAKNLLFVTGSNNEREIRRLRKIAWDEYQVGRYIVSKHLFKLSGSKFEKYD